MKKQEFDLPEADLVYYPDFLKKEEADHFYQTILENTQWRQDTIRFFGKEHLQPRLTALFAENDRTYTYSGLEMEPLPFPESILQIKKKLEELSGKNFTTCLLNLYRNGQDSMGWHSDDEKELGRNPTIASVSLGEERLFKLKHKNLKEAKLDLVPTHGSLLLMQGSTQHFWKHQLPKTKQEKGQRINLTFRKII